MLSKILIILRKISKIIAENDDQSLVLGEIVKVLSKNLDAEVCSIYVYDEEENELVLTATYGLNQDIVGKVRLKPGEGITGIAFKDGEIINIANPEKHPKYKLVKGSGEEKYKSFLSVPLTVGGKSVGVLNLQNTGDTPFTLSITDVVKSVCTQIANLIMSSKMLKVLAAESEPGAKGLSRKQKQVIVRGISANPGVAIGTAVIYAKNDYFAEIKPEKTTDAAKESLLFEHAIKAARKETAELGRKAISLISEADASIFDVHILFLDDKTLLDAIKQKLSEGYTVESSLKLVNDDYQKRFSRLQDQIFREKALDLKDVLFRIFKIVRLIRGAETKSDIEAGQARQIVFTNELLPSELFRMPIDKIAGIVCEKGGATAHVAILAKALNIPAIMGAKDAITHVRVNDEVILDCHSENVYIRPSENVKTHFRDLISLMAKEPEDSFQDEPSVMGDGTEISLRGNISLISETSVLKRYGAKGIGLYRTEFLFMIRECMPSEDSQYQVYSKIFKEIKGEDVTIRVLDIGADKPLPYVKIPEEDNPVLGWRGIRLLLSQRELFKNQLRAILRAGAQGRLKILFPMVSCVSQMIETRQILAEVESELHAKNIPHSNSYKVGMMLEVPSVIFSIEEFLEYVDFMSIGTNDLIQYSFAVDRGNEMVSALFNPLHPSFLKMISHIGHVFKSYPDKGIMMCGEMAGNPYALPFIIGAGIRDLSMGPKSIPSVKKVLRAYTVKECEDLLDRVVTLHNSESVECVVKQAFIQKGLKSLL
ncbi:MAG: phosphoenolpyruvate--protein phosphotransferase [Victivallales bacterium]